MEERLLAGAPQSCPMSGRMMNQKIPGGLRCANCGTQYTSKAFQTTDQLSRAESQVVDLISQYVVIVTLSSAETIGEHASRIRPRRTKNADVSNLPA